MTKQGATEQGTADPRTALDNFFATLRGIGIRRRTDDTWIAGVCSGLADRLRVDPVIIRVALVILAAAWGFGFILYLAAWVLLADDKEEIAAERAIRNGDGGAVVLLIVAAFVLFAIVTAIFDSGEALFLMVPLSLCVWWLTHPKARGQGWSWRANERPEADQRVSAQQPATAYSAAQSTTQYSTSPYPATPSQAPLFPGPSPAGPPPAASPPVRPVKPRRRSGGLLMALLAIGIALVTYGALSWLGPEYGWTGNHVAIALAGSLAAIGLLLVVLGLAGWRAGFVAFLAVVLAITSWLSTVAPAGINLSGGIGDETWTPTSVTTDADYRLAAGEGVLDLSGLPREGLSAARLPAYVGLGDLMVIVPEGLTVEVRGHVGLGEIVLPRDTDNGGPVGTDLSRTQLFGDGPTEVVVDAGVGIGQLTVVKE